MPNEVKALYLSMGDISSIDTFINIAKNTGVNAFVVDIKDGQLAYVSEVAKTYSPKDIGFHSVENYKKATNWSVYASQIKPLSEYVE